MDRVWAFKHTKEFQCLILPLAQRHIRRFHNLKSYWDIAWKRSEETTTQLRWIMEGKVVTLPQITFWQLQAWLSHNSRSAICKTLLRSPPKQIKRHRWLMSEDNNANLKGLGFSFFVITVIMVVIPVAIFGLPIWPHPNFLYSSFKEHLESKTERPEWFRVKWTDFNPGNLTFSWITSRKLWVPLWMTQKPIYKVGMVVILILAFLWVTEFSLSNMKKPAPRVWIDLR